MTSPFAPGFGQGAPNSGFNPTPNYQQGRYGAGISAFSVPSQTNTSASYSISSGISPASGLGPSIGSLPSQGPGFPSFTAGSIPAIPLQSDSSAGVDPDAARRAAIQVVQRNQARMSAARVDVPPQAIGSRTLASEIPPATILSFPSVPQSGTQGSYGTFAGAPVVVSSQGSAPIPLPISLPGRFIPALPNMPASSIGAPVSGFNPTADAAQKLAQIKAAQSQGQYLSGGAVLNPARTNQPLASETGHGNNFVLSGNNHAAGHPPMSMAAFLVPTSEPANVNHPPSSISSILQSSVPSNAQSNARDGAVGDKTRNVQMNPSGNAFAPPKTELNGELNQISNPRPHVGSQSTKSIEEDKKTLEETMKQMREEQERWLKEQEKAHAEEIERLRQRIEEKKKAITAPFKPDEDGKENKRSSISNDPTKRPEKLRYSTGELSEGKTDTITEDGDDEESDNDVTASNDTGFLPKIPSTSSKKSSSSSTKVAKNADSPQPTGKGSSIQKDSYSVQQGNASKASAPNLSSDSLPTVPSKLTIANTTSPHNQATLPTNMSNTPLNSKPVSSNTSSITSPTRSVSISDPKGKDAAAGALDTSTTETSPHSATKKSIDIGSPKDSKISAVIPNSLSPSSGSQPGNVKAMELGIPNANKSLSSSTSPTTNTSKDRFTNEAVKQSQPIPGSSAPATVLASSAGKVMELAIPSKKASEAPPSSNTSIKSFELKMPSKASSSSDDQQGNISSVVFHGIPETSKASAPNTEVQKSAKILSKEELDALLAIPAAPKKPTQPDPSPKSDKLEAHDISPSAKKDITLAQQNEEHKHDLDTSNGINSNQMNITPLNAGQNLPTRAGNANQAVAEASEPPTQANSAPAEESSSQSSAPRTKESGAVTSMLDNLEAMQKQLLMFDKNDYIHFWLRFDVYMKDRWLETQSVEWASSPKVYQSAHYQASKRRHTSDKYLEVPVTLVPDSDYLEVRRNVDEAGGDTTEFQLPASGWDSAVLSAVWMNAKASGSVCEYKRTRQELIKEQQAFDRDGWGTGSRFDIPREQGYEPQYRKKTDVGNGWFTLFFYANFKPNKNALVDLIGDFMFSAYLCDTQSFGVVGEDPLGHPRLISKGA